MLINGKPVWAYKHTQQPNDGIRIEGADMLAPGKHTIVLNFTYDGKKGEVGKGGAYVLSVDDNKVAETKIDETVPYIYSVDETLDIGEGSRHTHPRRLRRSNAVQIQREDRRGCY